MTNRAAAKAAFTRSGFLTEAEEFRLARLARAGDRRAMDKMIAAYDPFLRGMAIRHRSQTELEDRIQIARAAFGHVVQNVFDPGRGKRISAIAKSYVRRDLDNAGIANASRLTLGNKHSKNRRFAHQNVLRVCHKLGFDTSNSLTDEQVRAVISEIGVNKRGKDRVDELDVRGVLESGDAAFVFLDRRLSSGNLDPYDLLPDETDEEQSIEAQQETANRLTLLEDAIAELDDLNAEIIRTSVLSEEPQPLSKLLKRHGCKLTVAAARQCASAALEDAVRRLAAERGLMG